MRASTHKMEHNIVWHSTSQNAPLRHELKAWIPTMCSKSVAFIPINSLNSLSLEKEKHSVELGGSLVPKVCLSSKRNCNSLA